MATEIPFYSDSYSLTIHNPREFYAHKYATTIVVSTEIERWNESTDEEWTERTTVTVLACSVCQTNPAFPQHKRDDSPSVCSRECGRIEDEACDAASEAYYAREF